MLITPHAVVGGTIGAFIDNPWTVIILALISHFLMDMIPHYDVGVRHYYQKKIVLDKWDWLWLIADGLISIVLIYNIFIISGGNWLIVLGGVAGIAPDIIDDIFRVGFKDGKISLDMDKKIPVITQLHTFHEKIHYRLKPEQWYVGVITQIIVVAICLYILI